MAGLTDEGFPRKLLGGVGQPAVTGTADGRPMRQGSGEGSEGVPSPRVPFPVRPPTREPRHDDRDVLEDQLEDQERAERWMG